MRKILFRGRDDKGRWREGSLITRIEESPVPETAVAYVVHYIKFPATGRHPDIWEGDVIEDEYGCRMVVLFDYHSRGFRAIANSKTSVCCEHLDEGYLYFKFKKQGAKVVENIHDNPELINDLNREVTKNV